MKRATILIIICLVFGCILEGCAEKENYDTSGAAQVSEKKSPAGEIKDPELGGLRYSGSSNADNIESISLSFILSEDKSSIHDFTVVVEDFHGTAEFSGGTVKVDAGKMVQTVMGNVPVNYEGDNTNISVGDNTIESLKFFEDGSAEMVFTYCYKETSPQQYEIPVPGIRFYLKEE